VENQSFANVIPDIAKRMQPITVRNYNLADYQYELIMESIADFEKDLDENHEVALYLASFGQSILMNVVSIGYANPSLIYFHGYVEDRFSTLIQHVSQLSFLLTSVEKPEPEKPPRRIGFDIGDR